MTGAVAAARRSSETTFRVVLFCCSVGFFLAAAVVAHHSWPSFGQPQDYGTPHGTVYRVPESTTTGGWTVVTVRDVFEDGYSFTAFVPLSSDTQNGPQFRVIQDDDSAALLVQSQVARGNQYEHKSDGLLSFVIHRPPRVAGDPAVPRLDLSIVPGTVMFVNFRCQLPDTTGQITGEPSGGLPTTGTARLPGTASTAGQPPASASSTSPTVTPPASATVPQTAEQRRAGAEAFCRAAPTKEGGQNVSAPGVVRYYVQELGVVSIQPTFAARVAVVSLVAASFLFLVWALFAHKGHGGIKYLMIGRDNRYSNAQFQTVVWFFIFLVALVSTQLFRVGQGGLRLAAWVSVPANLVALSGLSALTFVGASIITNTQVKKNEIVKPKAQAPHFPDDLFHNDAGEFDLSDFQSALVSVLAAGAYLVILLGYLGSLSLKRDILPDVDGTILSIFGIAQGAYLLKKALKVSEQEGIALGVTPETVECSPGGTGTAVMIVAWNQKFGGQILALSALQNQVAYSGVTFNPASLALTAPELRDQVLVTITNPGSGAVHEVTLRGVVGGVVRDAKLTVKGT